MKGIVIPDADISIYDAKVTAYFTGVERYEQKLKQDGIIPAQKGGTDFPVELFRETCKLAHEKCLKKPRVGLFNLMAWYTCGRSTNVDHFNFTADCQKNKRAWRVWKHVMEYLASKLDELKEKRIYDWSTADPVNPKTLMFVAQVVPAAPPKAGGRKRQVIPSKNSVGTVRKNMSLLSLCAAE